VHLIYFVRVY